MRSRLAAFLILVVLLAVPAGLYWYFFMSQVASVTVSVPPGTPYHVLLVGTLDNKSLPLADKLIRIERDCIGDCLLSPIAPIHYALTLTSSGKTTITDDITLGVSESRTLSYVLQSEVTIEPLATLPLASMSIGTAMVGNAVKKDPDFGYILVGVGSGDIVYAERTSTGTRELGILSLERFTPTWKIPKGVGSISLDITGEYFLAPLFAGKTLILSRDMTGEKELPFTGVIGYSEGLTDAKILTNSGVITSWHGSYGDNPRFTDWLDLSPRERLGYISGDDTSKLTLSNLPSGDSVLVLLDRQTNQSQVVKKGVDIRFLFSSQGVPVFLDHEGKMWKIGISNN